MLSVFVTQTHVVAAANSAEKFLVIHRGSGKIQSQSSPPNVPYHGSPVVRCWGVIGIVKEEDAVALALITESKSVATVRNCAIHAITGVKVVPISILPDGDCRGFSGIEKFFTLGCYYSQNYDLTRPFQHAFTSADKHVGADLRFYWNREMYADFAESDVDHFWMLPVIQGFVGTLEAGTTSEPISVTLISRRSCYMAGTRYIARGIDDDGNVANFVESEQILEFRSSFFFFLQTRGSVPVFWQQSGVISAPIAVVRSKESTAPAFLKHFESMLSSYGGVMIVNLLSEKSGEAELAEAYAALWTHFRRQLGESVQKFDFDYSRICKHGHHSRVRELLEATHDILAHYGFGTSGVLSCEQRGVPRVNCLDCLDRTNVVMARFAWETLVRQFSVVQVPVLLDYDAKDTDPLLKRFKNLWANNGDMLSKQYTGVGSVSSMVTRKGKKGFTGLISHGFRTVGRMLSAATGKTQANIDLVLGSSSPRAAAQLLHMITVRVCSWDLSGEGDPLISDLQKWLVDPQLPFPHIVVVGLQEVTTFLGSSTREVAERWNERIAAVLTRESAVYKWVHTVDFAGCALSLFALEALLPKITAVETDRVKRGGLKRALGNKGAVLLRLSLYEASICFANCCLPGGISGTEDRVRFLEKLHRKAFSKKRKVPAVADHSAAFLFGNLNFRIAADPSVIYTSLEHGDYRELLEFDELRRYLELAPALRNYCEGEIAFRPTFKYKNKSHFYDNSKSSRAPAWCDRILVTGSAQEVSYSSVDSLHSSHRPVTATFMLATGELGGEAGS